MSIKKVKRIGETKLTNAGHKMTIIEYNNSCDVLIQFESGHTKKVRYADFVRGKVANLFERTTQNIGYLGEGEYISKIGGKVTIQYATWFSMFMRCYNESYLRRYPTYIGCSVCEEWHNFQTFAKWYDENYYEILGEKMNLDKDILVKGNKVYGPDTCIFVSSNINSLFLKNNASRGKHPIGVLLLKGTRIYKAYCNNSKRKLVHLGHYTTSDEAFWAYKIYKENLIKQIADEYRDRFPERLYRAMYNYRVEITD